MNEIYPVGLRFERRALQATVAVLSLIPLGFGAAGVWLGPGLVHGPNNPDLASHFAYLSGIFFGLGLLFLATVPAIERNGALFRGLCALVILGGLARLETFAAVGPPSTPHCLALGMELVIVPALAFWQTSLARRCDENASRALGARPFSSFFRILPPDWPGHRSQPRPK